MAAVRLANHWALKTIVVLMQSTSDWKQFCVFRSEKTVPFWWFDAKKFVIGIFDTKANTNVAFVIDSSMLFCSMKCARWPFHFVVNDTFGSQILANTNNNFITCWVHTFDWPALLLLHVVFHSLLCVVLSFVMLLHLRWRCFDLLSVR